MEYLYKLWLATQLTMGTSRFDLLLERFSSAQFIFENLDAIKAEYPRLITDSEMKRLKAKSPQTVADSILKSVEKNNVAIYYKNDSEYPSIMRSVPFAPNILFVRGTMPQDEQIKVAVVGTRKCSAAGRTLTEHVVEELCDNDVAVISGLAYGIDTIAATTALKHGTMPCKTVAVLGNGVDVVYPATNRKLYETIIENGAVVSQFVPSTLPTKYTFPQRNYVIAAMSECVFLTEAGDGSGALITARHADKMSRRVFYFSEKTARAKMSNRESLDSLKYSVLLNNLSELFSAFKNNTGLICNEGQEQFSFFDFITHYNFDVTAVEDCSGIEYDTKGKLLFDTDCEAAGEEKARVNSLTPEEQRIYDFLLAGERYYDEIYEYMDFSADYLNFLLTTMEFSSIIVQSQGRLYSLIHNSYMG